MLHLDLIYSSTIKIQTISNLILMKALKLKAYQYYNLWDTELTEVPPKIRNYIQNKQIEDFFLGQKSAYSRNRYKSKKDELVFPLRYIFPIRCIFSNMVGY